MGRLFGLLGAVLVLVGGCGLAKQIQINKEAEAAKKAQAAQIAECERLFPDRLRKPVTPRVKCFNEANLSYHMAYARSVGNPYLDLVRLMTAQMLLIAEKYDAGGLTEAQFEVAKATAQSDYASKVADRKNASAMVGAAQTQADAAQRRAIAASMPVTCNRYGNSVTCY
jgi:hypothetical protein